MGLWGSCENLIYDFKKQTFCQNMTNINQKYYF